MKYFLSLLFSFLLAVATTLQAQDKPNVANVDTTNQTAINVAVFNRVHNALISDSNLSMQQLVVKVALQLLETPYVGFTLESMPEQLQVMLDKTDCILFVELSVAMALTIRGERIVQAGDGEHYSVREKRSVEKELPSYALLCDNIRNLRYRLGVVDGYASRVHYTSEWLFQNQTNGLMREYTCDLGKEFDQQFYYMSMHPRAYYQLSMDPCELGKIRLMEQRLAEAKPYFKLTQDDLRKPEIISHIQDGDIITFVDKEPGLDLAHVAIAYSIKGTMHFIHASYRGKKVMIEPTSLADYAKNGIRITRLK